MNKKIINQAKIKFKKLSKNYNGFINVILDDWRGYRFIYDCVEVRNCQSRCSTCQLFKLLKNEKAGLFSAALYPARPEDKKLFGPQKYLNCKTMEQYKNCYLNFMNKKTLTAEEIKEELKLVRNLRFIFSKNNDVDSQEKQFKFDILNQIGRCDSKK